MIRATALLIVLTAICSPPASSQERPWRNETERPDIRSALANAASKRANPNLCQDNKIMTMSPLDRAILTATARREMSPSLAQAAGFVSMVASNQRTAAFDIAVERLRATGHWPTNEVDGGFFAYLVKQAGESRDKSALAYSIAGQVAGTVIGGLGGSTFDALTNGWGSAQRGIYDGREQGKQLSAQIPTTVSIIQDESAVITGIDTLIGRPCEIAAGDLTQVLRQR